MSVGRPTTSTEIDGNLINVTLQMRAVFQQVRNLNTMINQSGNATTFLTGAGYTAADAATVLTLLGQLTELSNAYFGTAAIPAAHNFDSALSVLWGGSIS